VLAATSYAVWIPLKIQLVLALAGAGLLVIGIVSLVKDIKEKRAELARLNAKEQRLQASSQDLQMRPFSSN